VKKNQKGIIQMNKPLPILLQLDDPDRGVDTFIRAVIASELGGV